MPAPEPEKWEFEIWHPYRSTFVTVEIVRNVMSTSQPDRILKSRTCLLNELLNATSALRKFTACFTGSPQAGDALIEQCLREIVDRQVALIGPSVTLSVFKAVYATQSFVNNFKHLNEMRGGAEDKLLAKVLALAPQQRGALLLVHTTGLSYAAAAEVMGLPDDEVEQLAVDALLQICSRVSPDAKASGRAITIC